MLWFLIFVVLSVNGQNITEILENFGPTHYVLGGKATTIDKFPYQVGIEYYGDYICGGSILNEITILTAAHCIANVNVDEILIRAGASIRGQGGITVGIEKTHKHSEYNPENSDNDIAIILLKELLNFTLEIQSIEILTSEEFLEIPVVGNPATVTGWGLLENGGENAFNLQVVGVTIFNETHCKNAYPEQITSSMFCAGEITGGKDACQGDSGSPLVWNNYKLIGIVSWGFECGRADSPGVYINVTYYEEWINSTVENLTQSNIVP